MAADYVFLNVSGIKISENGLHEACSNAETGSVAQAYRRVVPDATILSSGGLVPKARELKRAEGAEMKL